MEKITTEPIVIERVFNASVSTIWKAITYKDEMKNWYFDYVASPDSYRRNSFELLLRCTLQRSDLY